MTVATARATMADLVPRLVLRVACCSVGALIRCTQVQQDMSWGYHLDGNLGTTKSHAPAPVSGGVGRRGEPGQDMAGVRTEKAQVVVPEIDAGDRGVDLEGRAVCRA